MRRLRLALSRRGLSNGEWKLAGHGLNGGCYKGAIVMMLGSRVSADFGAFLCVLNGLLLLDKNSTQGVVKQLIPMSICRP
ncbi:hypothetical protein J2X10_002809 [Pseudomonas peli]|jgi:hypothetical protein|nr:hypothetical protein [Pseudomonas peli]